MKKQISYKIVSLVFAVIVACFALGFYIFAWTDPSGDPPLDNVDVPLNTGIDGQIKDGGLLLGNSSSVTNGLLVRYGDVGIGTTNPGTYKLYVNGRLRAGDYYSGAGSQGISRTVQVMQTGYGLCTMTFEDGLLISTTCPNW